LCPSRRPPGSTPFPYTTLFRSRRGEDLHRSLDRLVLEGEAAEEILAEVSRRIGNPVVLEDTRGELVALGSVTRREDEVVDTWSGDRKSTRLNSSHVKISYAVFC